MQKYYRKSVVKTPIYLSNGARVLFTDVGDDTGVFSTADPGLQNEFESCVRMQRGGIEEIDMATYDELVARKKKSTPHVPLSSRFDQRASANPAAVAASAVAAGKPIEPAVVPLPPTVDPIPPLAKVEPLVVPEFKPRVGRRPGAPATK